MRKDCTGFCGNKWVGSEKHRQVWLDMIPPMEKYHDRRGEMHILFVGLEKGKDADTFKPLLKVVLDTWGEIEAAMKE
ncbi:MAG: hypothetical protein EPGJADBJ_04701 [Saprospiraceae bacterium]|nr:hypothetical protein [Saprospiraceae bacterium]